MKKKTVTYHVVQTLCLVFLKLFYPYEVENGHSLPKDKGMIVCSNHISNLDPVLINATQNRLLHFMAKKELFKNKLFASIIRKCGAFPVDRGHDGGKAVSTAEELLKDENCLGIFIEGTRSKTGNLGKPRSGALRIAFATKKPIVPCFITGKSVFIKPFKKTKISYGEPLTCEELGLIEGTMKEYRAAAEIVMKKIAELREKHTAEFESKS